MFRISSIAKRKRKSGVRRGKHSRQTAIRRFSKEKAKNGEEGN